MSGMALTQGTVVKNALIDNQIIEYDTCSSICRTLPDKGFKYIGTGTIHSVNGIEQKANTQYSFFKSLNGSNDGL